MNDDLLNSRQDICCPLKKCLVLCQLVLLDFVKTYFYLLALIEVMGIDWVTRSWIILSKEPFICPPNLKIQLEIRTTSALLFLCCLP